MLDLSDEEYLKKAFSGFKNVRVYKNWEGFGEIALIT